VELKHYGRVTWGSGAMPVIVSKCDNQTECSPGSDDVTGQWEVANSPGTRSLVVQLKSGQQLVADHHYHFQPVRSGANQLSCHDISVSGVPVRSYMYSFNFAP
jgi:hypothetical protein